MNMWSFGVILEINKEIYEIESFLVVDWSKNYSERNI